MQSPKWSPRSVGEVRNQADPATCPPSRLAAPRRSGRLRVDGRRSKLAARDGDRVGFFQPGTEGLHPRSYGAVAASVGRA